MLLPLLLGLVGFLVYRKVSERKASATPAVDAGASVAVIPPPRKFVL